MATSPLPSTAAHLPRVRSGQAFLLFCKAGSWAHTEASFISPAGE